MQHNYRSLTTLGIEDFPMFVSVCVVYLIYRVVFTNFILKLIAKLLNVKKNFKFVHRSFDFVHYSLSSMIGLYSVLDRPYKACFFFAKECGEAFIPEHKIVMSEMEKIYYMFFTAYYVVDLFFIYTATEKKTLLLHHFTTLSLIFISIYIKTTVIGIAVMLLHDVVDVPLYLGKILTYLGYETFKDISLLTFAVMCTWFRMVNYPIVIFHCWKGPVPDTVNDIPIYQLEKIILFVLMGCHVFWFIKIVQAAIGIFTKGSKAICDNRSD